MAKSNIVQGSFLEQCDCDIISFLDTSTYLPNITNPILRIFPPNWSEYINIPYNLNQITLITPGLLKHSTLPSGVYKIIQSVCPNDKSFKEYCYLQVCKDLQSLKEIVCEYSEDEIIMNKVFTLKMQLEAAQDLVYECDVNKGTELYNITVNQIKDLKNGMCSL